MDKKDENNNTSMSETDYLLSSPSNRQRLLESIAEFKKAHTAIWKTKEI